MKILELLAGALATLAVATIGAGQLGLLAGTAPSGLGVVNGRLQAPSVTPNSVSSQASQYPGHPQRDYASMPPLVFTGDPASAMRRLAEVLRTMNGTTIVEQKSDYLRAECRTRVLQFTDDVEFWLDAPAGLIHFRSASRLGRKDFGVNRARMEAIRARFQN